MLLGLLFDLDLTLVEAHPHIDYCAALRDITSDLTRTPQDALPATNWGACSDKVMRALATASGDSWAIMSHKVEGHELAGVESTQLMPYAKRLLSETSEIPRAIVTSMGQIAATRVLARHNIEAQAVIGRTAGLRLKPAPDQVNSALESLEVRAADALMVGDSAWDALAAHRAGVRFIGVSNGISPAPFNPSTQVVDNALDVLAVARSLRGTPTDP